MNSRTLHRHGTVYRIGVAVLSGVGLGCVVGATCVFRVRDGEVAVATWDAAQRPKRRRSIDGGDVSKEVDRMPTATALSGVWSGQDVMQGGMGTYGSRDDVNSSWKVLCTVHCTVHAVCRFGWVALRVAYVLRKNTPWASDVSNALLWH